MMDNIVDRDWKKMWQGGVWPTEGTFCVLIETERLPDWRICMRPPCQNACLSCCQQKNYSSLASAAVLRVVTAIKHFRKHNALSRKQFLGNVFCKNNLQILQSVWLLHEERFCQHDLSVHTFSRFKNFCFENATIRGSKIFITVRWSRNWTGLT